MTEGEILAAEMVVTVGMVRLMGSRQGVNHVNLVLFTRHAERGRERNEAVVGSGRVPCGTSDSRSRPGYVLVRWSGVAQTYNYTCRRS